jgi:glutamate racemase
MVTAANPVGVFDSGVGGLSVLRAIRRELPHENLLYVADSAYAPYGDRPTGYIENRATAVVQFLIAEGAKAVVVACNTATGIAVDALRSRFSLPIVAIEPAVKPAASHTRSGVVGVLGTTQTLSSSKFSRLLATYGENVEIVVQSCPGLVEQVERGELSSPATRLLVQQYVRPLLDKGADTLVLGCTHYPFLSSVIQAVAGPGVAVINPAEAVARELRRRLESGDRLSRNTRQGTEQFWTSGPPDRVRAVIEQLWVKSVDVEPLPRRFRDVGT